MSTIKIRGVTYVQAAKSAKLKWAFKPGGQHEFDTWEAKALILPITYLVVKEEPTHHKVLAIAGGEIGGTYQIGDEVTPKKGTELAQRHHDELHKKVIKVLQESLVKIKDSK